MDNHPLLQDITMDGRAELAKQILDNPIFHAALQKVREGLFASWCNTKYEDFSSREQLYAEYAAAGRIIHVIMQYVQEVQLFKEREALKERDFGIA
jgi:cellulase/cellobiase CelA1